MHSRFSVGSTRRIVFVAAVIVLAALIGSQPAFPQSTPSGPIRLLKDFNQTNKAFLNPSILGSIGDDLLFVQEIDPHGRELWATDGTAAGTRLLYDFHPGMIDSNIEFSGPTRKAIAVVGDKVVLAAYNEFYGYEPYIYNHTTGTVKVLDLAPGTSSSPFEFVVYNDKVYFTATGNGANDHELWVVDPATETAAQVADAYVGALGSDPSNLTATAFGLFFAADDGTHGRELWVTDGSAAGTRMLKDINPDQASTAQPDYLTLFDNRLFFTSPDDSGSASLWASDGTENGTVRITPPNGSTTGIAPDTLHVFNGKLYFNAYDVNGNYWLWSSDGTDAGTVSLDKPTGSAFASDAQNMFFIAEDPDNNFDWAIWKSDGTITNTLAVTLIPTTTRAIGEATMIGNRYAVNLIYTNFGGEIWTSDGTSQGSGVLKDINPNANDLSDDLFTFGNTLYFSANDGIHGTELWKSDGTANGTGRVYPVDLAGVSFASVLAKSGNTIYISADDGVNGFELWRSDGTSTGTTLLKDINPDATDGIPDSSSPARMIDWNGTAYFAATDGVNGTEIWQSDGTTDGTVMMANVRAGTRSLFPRELTVLGDKLIFRANENGNTEIWQSDTTISGTFKITEINTDGPSDPAFLRLVGSQVTFAANDGTHGRELWVTDGSAANTLLVTDIYSGTSSSNPGSMLVNDGKLIFSATDDEFGRELWQYDPATSNAEMLIDLYPGITGANPTLVRAMSDGLVFNANTPGKGVELVRLKGNEVTVFDINPGPGNSNPSWNVLVGNDLYFAADNGSHGFELWKLSPGGTPVLVRDINPGTASSYPEYMTAAPDGRTVVFKADDGVHGHELWRSDGRSTALVQDLEPGSGSSSPVNLRFIGNTLYMSASQTSTGNEVYLLDAMDLRAPVYLPLVVR